MNNGFSLPDLGISPNYPRPLKIAVLVKQVPQFENFRLGGDGRLIRSDIPLEMGAYCRRAVTKAVAIAASSGGQTTVFTLGPESARSVLREAIAGGVDRGVHLCDKAFAGSDTLATSRALHAALGRFGPFDLVILGRNSLDSDTGQVGPQLAELLGLPYLPAVRELAITGDTLRAWSESDDGFVQRASPLPVVVGAAERLCAPTKMPEAADDTALDARIVQVGAPELGDGPWGADASPTKVGPPRQVALPVRHRRVITDLSPADIDDVARQIVHRLKAREQADDPVGGPVPAAGTRSGPAVCVILSHGDSLASASELLGGAAGLAHQIHGHVVAFACRADGDPDVDTRQLGAYGADVVTVVHGTGEPQGAAAIIADWSVREAPWAILCRSDTWGREVASRVAARTASGLTGDASSVELDPAGRLVAWKSAAWGATEVPIMTRSATQMVTLRPGAFPILRPRRAGNVVVRHVHDGSPGATRTLQTLTVDQPGRLASAAVVIGLGQGVAPDDYPLLDRLRNTLNAEFAATRKVTDKGWMPRSRQLGITGASVSPAVYIALAASGKFNHMAGVTTAELVLGVNADPEAPLFRHVDIGIVGDWREVTTGLRYSLSALLDDGVERKSAAASPEDGPG